MSYQDKIVKWTGCSPADAREIEDYMRDAIFHSTLDWQTGKQLRNAAKTAWNDIQYMRSPAGVAYMADLEKQFYGH